MAPASEARPIDPVRGDRERGRPQPVAVHQRAHPVAVREHDGSRPIPRRHEPGGPAPPRGDLRVWRAAQGGCLGDRRQERGRQRPAGRRQEFEGLVQRQRVGAVRRQERPGGQQVGGHAARSAAGIGGPAAHLLAVAADRVDLAVVGDRAERLGEPPDRVRVRRVALMEDRVVEAQRGPQVRVEVRQSPAGHQTLVDDRPTRCRRDRQLGDHSARRPCCSLDPAPGETEPALEGVVGGWAGVARGPVRSRHDRLGEGRPGRSRRRAQCARIGRDLAPAEDAQARFVDGSLDECPGTGRRWTVARQEAEQDAREPVAAAAGPPISSRSDRSSGSATPAPSLDSPSAPNAPRCASEASPASARGRTRSRDRPPASATNPTPHASCSKRASYSGASIAAGARSWRRLVAKVQSPKIGRTGHRREEPTVTGRDRRTRGSSQAV